MESNIIGSEPHQPEVPENGVDIPSLISRVKSSPPPQMKIQVSVVTVQPEALSPEPKHPWTLNIRSRKLPQTTMQYQEFDMLAKDHVFDYPNFIKNSQPSSEIPNFETVVQSEIESPSDLLKKQVYYIDKSPQQKQIDDLSGTDQPFVDNDFPASHASLFGNMQSDEKGYQERKYYLDWRSIFEVIPKGELFVGGINPSDINQKGFGGCYFLVGLSALAERPQRIRDIFLKQEVDKHLYFACMMMFRGRWQTIYVDQKFPLPKKKYEDKYGGGVSRGSTNQLWVPVLEKAWSKLYGSYYIAEGGFTEEALHDLTGAHIRYANTRGAFFDKEKTWERLLEGTNKGFAMLAESPQNPDPITDQNPKGMKDVNQTGMVFGHAYTILGAYEIDYKGKTKRLLRCRNPWASQDQKWKFEWSTDDPKWNKISEEEKRRVRYEDTKKGGQFFIHYDDCCEWLTKITIGEIHDSYSYVCASKICQGKVAYETYKGVEYGYYEGEAYFKVTILKEGEYSFQLNQTAERFFRERINGKKMTPGYRTVTMNIGRVLPNGELEYYRGAQWSYQIVYRKHILPPGEYIVYAKQNFHSPDIFLNNITLGIYGQYYCTVEEAPSRFTKQFHARLLLSRTRQLGQQLDDGVLVANEVLGSDGLLYAAVINDTQKPVSIMVKGYSNLNTSVGKITDRKERIDPKKNLVLFAQVDLTHRFNNFTSKLCGITLIK